MRRGCQEAAAPRSEGRGSITESAPQGPDRLVPGWWVRLDGDPMDLKWLAKEIAGDELVVVRIGETYYLRAAGFEGIDSADSATVDQRAKEVLAVVNGAAQVGFGDHRAVTHGAAALVREDGSIEHFVHASSVLWVRGRMRTKGSVPDQPPDGPSEIERIALQGLRDEHAELALRIFGRDDLDYRDLYFVYDIVKAAVGGKMYTERWATQAEIRRFKHTADSLTALGEQARHGSERTQPPKNPMPLPEAKELIRRLLSSWLG